MTGWPVRAVGALATLFLLAAGLAAAAPVTGLTARATVAEAYDAILAGRFDDWPAVARATCPPAPAPVCQALELAARWWQIQVDPENRTHDAAFEARADAAVAVMEAWTAREPERAEAWFYRGATYGARAQWRVLRGQRIAAARDGKRIKNALERALALDPGLQDAWFGIGLYHYYADVAPAAAKILRFLLLLPGGDREEGMTEMLRARANGALLQGEIDYQLHVLDLWYEEQPRRAIERLTGLRRTYPTNPHFLQTIAEIQDTYLHDAAASLGSWTELADAARAGRVRQADAALALASLGMGTQLDRLAETDRAIAELQRLVASRPTAPAGLLPRAQVQLGDALSRMGQAADAAVHYRAALTARPDRATTARARAGLSARVPAAQAAASRASLEGWRALERGDLRTAGPLISSAAAAQPDDPVYRYREARWLIARGEDAAAARVLDHVLTLPTDRAPTFSASAAFDAGTLAERHGEVSRALDYYARAAATIGADARTVADARRARARLGAR